MTPKNDTKVDCNQVHYQSKCGATGNNVYGLGVIGALVYFYPQMTNFNSFIVSIGKSLVWPALLVFEALKLLKL